MLLRLIFVLLVALNIAVGAWLWLGREDGYVPAPSDPGVPRLALLAERPAPAASAPPPAAAPHAAGSAPAAASVAAVGVAGSAPAPATTTAVLPVAAASLVPAPAPAGPLQTHRYACVAIGPFENAQALHAARALLAPHAAKLRSRQERSVQSRGWWVFLPAASRAQAQGLAARLEAAHVGDHFLVGGGDQPNAVSLGLFKDPANARKRRDEVAAAGFAAQMVERTEPVTEYWLDVATEPPQGESVLKRLRAEGMGSHSTSCF